MICCVLQDGDLHEAECVPAFNPVVFLCPHWLGRMHRGLTMSPASIYFALALAVEQDAEGCA